MLTQEDKDKFEELKIRWHDETCFLSNPNKIVGHEAYQEIITMGVKVVPLIMEELKKDCSWLFVALEKITGENPLTDGVVEQNGVVVKWNMVKIQEQWLDWWEKNKHNYGE